MENVEVATCGRKENQIAGLDFVRITQQRTFWNAAEFNAAVRQARHDREKPVFFHIGRQRRCAANPAGAHIVADPFGHALWKSSAPGIVQRIDRID